MARHAIALMGGTFDPVHEGHVQMAQAAWQALPVRELRLMPAGLPPHRETPHANSAHRLAMLRLAIAGCEGLRVDDRETHRAGPCYSIDTLDDLRAECGPSQPLVWVMGADALAGIASWKDWQRLPALCHFAILARPGYPVTVPDDWEIQRLQAASQLCEAPAGGLWVLENPLLDVSATAVRHALEHGAVPAGWLHPDVQAYIDQQQLYRQP